MRKRQRERRGFAGIGGREQALHLVGALGGNRAAAAARSAAPPPSAGRQTTGSASSARGRAPSAPSGRSLFGGVCVSNPGERLLLIRRGPQRPAEARALAGGCRCPARSRCRSASSAGRSSRISSREQRPRPARGSQSSVRASRIGIETSRICPARKPTHDASEIADEVEQEQPGDDAGRRQIDRRARSRDRSRAPRGRRAPAPAPVQATAAA